METYRVLWLSICVPLGVIGTAVALAVSPAAVSSCSSSPGLSAAC